MYETPDSVRMTDLSDRFRYWTGVSGRRYLFSTVTIADLRDFADAVVLISTGENRDTQAGRVWVGETDCEGNLTGPQMKPREGSAFVHLLSTHGIERRSIVEDLAATKI